MTTAPVEIGREPRSPWRLAPREWVDVLKRSLQSFLADDAMGLSAQVAFSSLLAFFPAMVFLVGLLDLVGAYEALRGLPHARRPRGGDRHDRDAAAGHVDGYLGGRVRRRRLGRSLGGERRDERGHQGGQPCVRLVETRPFWKLRIVAIFLVVLTGLVLAGLLLLIVFGGPLGSAIAEQAGLGDEFELLWTTLRWPLAFAAILLFFALVYYLAPNVDHRSWAWLTPGSLVGAVSWLVLSGLFALYTSFSDSYSRTYGALASGIVLLLWLNYSAFALLFGAELNSELDRQAEIHAAGGPNAGLVEAEPGAPRRRRRCRGAWRPRRPRRSGASPS